MRYAGVVLTADWGSESPCTAQIIGHIKQVDPNLEVCPAHIWLERHNVRQSSDLLYAMLPFWPQGTVFLNLVHSPAGEARWLAAELNCGCVLLTPDNGSITLPLRLLGVGDLRLCPGEMTDAQAANLAARLARDGFAAHMAAAPKAAAFCQLPWQDAALAPGRAEGAIGQVMQNFGNLTTTIPTAAFQTTGIRPGDMVQLTLCHAGQPVYDCAALYHHAFGFAPDGAPIVFNGSNGFIGFGLNRSSFAAAHLPRLLEPGANPLAYSVSICAIQQECAT